MVYKLCYHEKDVAVWTKLLFYDIFFSQKDYQTAIQFIPSPQVAVHQVGFHHSDFASKSVSARLTNDTLTLWAPSTHLAKHMFILKFGQSVLDVIQEYSSGNRPLVNGPINIVAVPKTIETYEAGSWNLLTVGYVLNFLMVLATIKISNLSWSR